MDCQCQSKIQAKREHEKKLVSKMIAIYCKKKHKTRGGLCKECKELNAYALKRIDKCPLMETKTFCSSCPIHCYSSEAREQIRKVMRFSGPYLIFYCPIEVVRHFFDFIKTKKLQGAKNAN